MELIVLAVLAFGVPFLINLVCTPAIIAFADRFKLYDRINARKIHSGNISRLAGIGICLSFTIGSAVVLGQSSLAPELTWLMLLPLIGGILVFVIGLIDDFYELRARYKLVVQIVASLSVVFGGFVFTGVDVPGFHVGFDFGYFGHFLN